MTRITEGTANPKWLEVPFIPRLLYQRSASGFSITDHMPNASHWVQVTTIATRNEPVNLEKSVAASTPIKVGRTSSWAISGGVFFCCEDQVPVEKWSITWEKSIPYVLSRWLLDSAKLPSSFPIEVVRRWNLVL